MSADGTGERNGGETNGMCVWVYGCPRAPAERMIAGEYAEYCTTKVENPLLKANGGGGIDWERSGGREEEEREGRQDEFISTIGASPRHPLSLSSAHIRACEPCTLDFNFFFNFFFLIFLVSVRIHHMQPNSHNFATAIHAGKALFPSFLLAQQWTARVRAHGGGYRSPLPSSPSAAPRARSVSETSHSLGRMRMARSPLSPPSRKGVTPYRIAATQPQPCRPLGRYPRESGVFRTCRCLSTRDT